MSASLYLHSPKVLDRSRGVAVKKEEYQLFEELGRGRFGIVFACFQQRGPPLHRNGGLEGWWRGGGGCRQEGGGKEVAVVAPEKKSLS